MKDMNTFTVLRKEFKPAAKQYSLKFGDHLMLSSAAYYALDSPLYVKLDYNGRTQKLTIMKVSEDEAVIDQTKPFNPHHAIGSIGAKHRICGVLGLRRLIQKELQINQRFIAIGVLHEGGMVFDLTETVIIANANYGL